jgi:hypothetical protein
VRQQALGACLNRGIFPPGKQERPSQGVIVGPGNTCESVDSVENAGLTVVEPVDNATPRVVARVPALLESALLETSISSGCFFENRRSEPMFARCDYRWATIRPRELTQGAILSPTRFQVFASFHRRRWREARLPGFWKAFRSLGQACAAGSEGLQERLRVLFPQMWKAL